MCRVELHRHVQLVPLVFIVRFALVRLSTSLMDPSWHGGAARSFTDRTTLLLFDGSSQMVLGKLLTPPRPELFAFSMIALSSSSNLFCDSRSLRWAARGDAVIGGERLHQLDRR